MTFILYGHPPKVENIKIKKPSNMGNKKVFNIYYDYGDGIENELLIQSPIMIIPYSVIISENGKEIQFDCCNDSFVDDMENIRQYIFQRISSKYPDYFTDKMHLDKIKRKLFGKVFRCHVRDSSDIIVFDQNENQIDILNNLSAEKKISLIFAIRWFWVCNKFYGLDFKIYQIKIHLRPTHSLFAKIEDPYEKYIKMHKLKIPACAIEHKMLLDGLTNDDVQMFLERLKSSIYSPPPPPPPPPPPFTKIHSSVVTMMKSPLAFLNQIKNGEFKLKKINVEMEAKSKVMNKISKYVDTTRKVPTLDDIISSKSRLKKTNSPYMIETS